MNRASWTVGLIGVIVLCEVCCGTRRKGLGLAKVAADEGKRGIRAGGRNQKAIGRVKLGQSAAVTTARSSPEVVALQL